MDEKEQTNLYYEGFLQGPKESEKDFRRRIALTKEVAQNPEKLGLKDVEVGKTIGEFHLPWLLHKISNKGLPPWEGAAIWIIDYQGVKIPFLHLRKRFAQNEEVLKHELVHILRIAFDDPRFEEIIAFSTSKSRLRRWLGPLFRTPRESIFFFSLHFFLLRSLFGRRCF